MRYLTTCPHCESVLRISQEQLDAAAGWAQCGVCGEVFHAAATLTLADGSPVPAAAAPDAAVARESTEAAPPRSEARAGAAELPSIILIEPELAVSDEMGPVPEMPPPAASVAPPAAPVASAGAAPAPTRQRRTPSWPWALGGAALAILLIAQLVWFLRDSLIDRIPGLRPLVETVCAPLGCTPGLPKNRALLQIIGSDLQAEPGGNGRLKLKLTLGNRAPYAQAWPVIVLTLTDARDQPQVRRSFAPSEYLANPNDAEAGIPPQSEVPLTLAIETRGVALAGYRVELVY